MKSLIAIGFFFITTIGSAEAGTPASALASFHDALAGGDSRTAASLLSDAVLIFESGYVERSKAEYVGHHLMEDIDFARATNRKVLRQSENVASDVAVINSETETTGQFHGKSVHAFGTETAVLNRVQGLWLIQHVHWSSRPAKNTAPAPK